MAKLYHNLNQINRDKVDFRELKQKFININYSNISINGEIQLKLINQSVKQSGRCNAIVFDSSGSIMVSTEKNYIIKVWKFQNGKIKLITNLQGHTRHIQCLVYSKKQNSFISGAGDKTIRCWQQVDQFNWISSQAYQQHKDYVRCIILNQNEDLLFSGSTDRSIKVWKINLNKNKLKYLYSLYKHDDIVNALNLNQSETQLVSCAYNKYQIIIWENGEYNKFEFKYIIKQSIQDYGFKVQFIKDNQFIWLTGGQEIDKLFVFELIDGIFQENQDKTIQLLKNNSTIDEYRFPILYNKEMNLIVVRHKTYIYIIRQTNYEKLKIVDFLNCYTDDIYGMITNNAKYLVYWDKKNQAYSTYELLNKQKL
ncbi:unnamed protein product [Paramecium pentaurelia]|uniref:WD40-repeat-containing domain n=1 Tax=Paramecium pentaurelia TaxID=43138 RepID=A0A8S1WS18_9CILI|nr:unnamed protein product [Paramecium pentaurelia]